MQQQQQHRRAAIIACSRTVICTKRKEKPHEFASGRTATFQIAAFEVWGVQRQNRGGGGHDRGEARRGDSEWRTICMQRNDMSPRGTTRTTRTRTTTKTEGMGDAVLHGSNVLGVLYVDAVDTMSLRGVSVAVVKLRLRNGMLGVCLHTTGDEMKTAATAAATVAVVALLHFGFVHDPQC